MNYLLSMLQLFPHLHIGGNLYHKIFPRKANSILYITNRCNSRCKICNHWQQIPKIDLSIDVIAELLKSKSLYNNYVLEGGEAIYHPQFDEIMGLFKDKSYLLFSNGIDTDRLVRAVKRHKIPQVHISLDGLLKTYEKVRGVDKYQNVLNTIEALQGKTDLAVNFTISHLNDFEDYMAVKTTCDIKKVKLLLNIFADMPYMKVYEKEKLIDERFKEVDNRPYIQLYNRWLMSKIKIPCLAVRFTATIRPNGDIMLCQYKDIILGNLYEQSFDRIWNSKTTKFIQKNCISCNDCWVSSHRAFDARLELLKRKIFDKR